MILIEPSDKFEVTIDEAVFTISPYSKKQNLELEKCVRMEKGEEVVDVDKQMDLVFKYCIKDIKGVKKPDGSDFEFKFVDGELIQEHIDLLRMSIKASRIYLGINAVRMEQFSGQVKNHLGEELGIELSYLGK